jgi:hypothetical protein
MPVGPVITRLWRFWIQSQLPRLSTCCRSSARGCFEVDVLERGRVARLGEAQAPRELALLACAPIAVDQEAQPLLEAEPRVLAGTELLLQGVGHA